MIPSFKIDWRVIVGRLGIYFTMLVIFVCVVLACYQMYKTTKDAGSPQSGKVTVPAPLPP